MKLDDLGANYAYHSGQMAQHNAWLVLLTGEESPQGVNEPSQP